MKPATRADDALTTRAAKLEASAVRAEARGHAGRAAFYRKRAEQLRAQLSTNAKAWFETWSAKADEASSEAVKCEAAGQQDRARFLRQKAQEYRFRACRFNPGEEVARHYRRRGRVTIKLSQHALDVVEELGISTRKNGCLSIILEEAIYAFEEMRRDSVSLLYLRFHASARDDIKCRRDERACRAVLNAGEIQYQLAKAEFSAE